MLVFETLGSQDVFGSSGPQTTQPDSVTRSLRLEALRSESTIGGISENTATQPEPPARRGVHHARLLVVLASARVWVFENHFQPMLLA